MIWQYELRENTSGSHDLMNGDTMIRSDIYDEGELSFSERIGLLAGNIGTYIANMNKRTSREVMSQINAESGAAGLKAEERWGNK